MAQIKKVEKQVEINCNADKFFDVWARKTTDIDKICSNIHKVELVQGDNCHTPGAIFSWTFVAPVSGKQETLKTLLEEIDEKNRSLTYKATEGEILNKYYNTWREKVEITPKDDNSSILKWNLFECQKKCDDAPDPHIFVDFCLDCVKDVANHISSA